MTKMIIDDLTPGKSRLRSGVKNIAEDAKMWAAGVLDWRSFVSGYQRENDPVEFVFTRLVKPGEKVDSRLLVKDPRFFHNADNNADFESRVIRIGDKVIDKTYGAERIYTAIRRQHNLRTTLGRDQWQRNAMIGDVSASEASASLMSVTSGAGTSTTLTNTSASFPTTVSDAVTNTTTTVTSATAAFTNMDVGRVVTGTNIPANTYIASVTNATTIVLSNAATGSGSGGTLAISRLQGRLAYCRNASISFWGTIVSHTNQVITVDQWTDPTSATGAASGSTPGSGAQYIISPNAGVAKWVGLCATGGSGNPPTGGHSPVAGDVLRQADGLFGDGAQGAASEQTGSGLGRIFLMPTFPAAGQIQLTNTFTYTGSTVVTLDVCVLCNSKATAGSLLFLETQLNASAAVSANGDTVTPTWTINL